MTDVSNPYFLRIYLKSHNYNVGVLSWYIPGGRRTLWMPQCLLKSNNYKALEENERSLKSHNLSKI